MPLLMALPKPARWIALTTVLALGALIAWRSWRPDSPALPSAASPFPEPVRPQSAGPAPEQLARGEDLARKICVTCHLFPDPELLDRQTWKEGVLPWMASWVGLAPPPGERLPDGSLVDDASVYPSAPLLSADQWQAVVDYYLARAPNQLMSPHTRSAMRTDLTLFKPQTLPYQREVPMTALVKIDPANQTLYVGDAMSRTLEGFRIHGERLFTVEFDSSPISLRVQPGRVDVTLIGRLFPSDQVKGRQVILVPTSETMGMATMIGALRRPTDAVFADLNDDGKEDVVISQFGHLHGRLSWFEKTIGAEFAEHVLVDRPGAICAKVHDFNNDGLPDIMAVLGQAWEAVILWINAGEGTFKEQRLIEQPPVFGYSGLELVDFNRDGHMDFLTVNGDNGEYQGPSKPYHGIRLYLNDGHGHFREAWFFEFPGVYRVLARDFDQDGDIDLAAISFYPDFDRSPGESFVYLENRGGMTFQTWSFPQASQGRWMTMDAGDLDGDGDEDIVLGSLVLGPETVQIPERVKEAWRSGGPAVLWLQNLTR